MSTEDAVRPIGSIISNELKDKLLSNAATSQEINVHKSISRERDRLSMVNRFISEVGVKYQHCSFSNFVTDTDERKASLEKTMVYINELRSRIESGSSFVWIGGVGTGKDHLMVASLKEAAALGYSVKYIDGMEYFARFRDLSELHGIDAMESKFIHELVSPSVLGISDPVPPQSMQKSVYSEYLFRVVNGRYKQRKPTWITLNAEDPKESAALLGLSVRDRLRDGGYGVHCKGGSYRELKV